jgi:hypothetical protein
LLSGFTLHTCADDHLRALSIEVRRSRDIRRRTCTTVREQRGKNEEKIQFFYNGFDNSVVAF